MIVSPAFLLASDKVKVGRRADVITIFKLLKYSCSKYGERVMKALGWSWGRDRKAGSGQTTMAFLGVGIMCEHARRGLSA